MTPLDFGVPGGTLRALRFGDGPRIVLAAHGITASAMAFGAVARYLPTDWSLISLDLRGRGDSGGQPGPFGIDQHAADVCVVAKQLPGPVALTGHSMGAYVALRAAVKENLFSHLVLIDGGLPLPVPEGVDVDMALEATVGPAVARLRQTFSDEQSYLDFFRAHPALTADWNEDLEAYVRYDLTGSAGAHRSKANPAAVAQDGRDLFVNAASFGRDLQRLDLPTLLLFAPRGMLGQEPGLLPGPLVRSFAVHLKVELVEDTNHYTILMTEAAAALLAERITNPGSWERWSPSSRA